MKQISFLESKNPKISFLPFLLKSIIGNDHRIDFMETSAKVISEIQIIAILLYLPFTVLNNETSDAFGQFVEKITGYVTFSNVFDFSSASSLNNVLFIIIAMFNIIFAIFGIALIASYFLTKSINYTLELFWARFGSFHYNLGFLVAYQYILRMFEAMKNDQFILFGSTKQHTFLAIGIIILCITVPLALLFAKFSYGPLRNHYSIAMRSPASHFITLAFKLIDVPLTVFIDSLSTQKALRLIFMALLTLEKIRIFYKKVPYFYYNRMKLFQKLAFVQLAVLVVDIAVAIIDTFEDISSFSAVYASLILCGFFMQLSDRILHDQMNKYGSRSIENIKSRNAFHWKLFALEDILTKGFNRSKMKTRQNTQAEYLFYGIVRRHYKKCKKPTCGCQIVMDTKTAQPNITAEKEKQLLDNLKFEIIKGIFRDAIKKMPQKVELKVGLANLLFEHKARTYAPSISLIHTINLDRQSSEQKVIAISLLEKIQNQLTIDYANSVNVKEIVDYQAASQQLRELIESNIGKFVKFWETFREPEPSLKMLYQVSVDFNKEADRINLLWGRIIADYSKLAYQDLLLYGLYQSLARSAPYSAEKTLQKYFAMSNLNEIDTNSQHQVTPENMHEAANILVCISMKKEKLGIVTFITPNVEGTLGYNQTDVLDKDVNIMMPPFIQERHKKILLAHVENSRTSIFNRNRMVFTKNKSGYTFPCTIYVTMFPYFQEQLSYVAILRPMKTFDEFLLVLSDGTIDSFSESLGKLLNLRPENVRKYHLRDISKELARLHRAFLPFIGTDENKFKHTHSRRSFSSRAFSNANSKSTLTVVDVTRKSRDLSNLGRDDSQQQSPKERENSQENELMYRKTTTNVSGGDLESLYDTFLTNGVMIMFSKIGEYAGESLVFDRQIYEYNTTISEENILGSHLRVFRLQNTSSDECGFQENQVLQTLTTIKKNKEKTFLPKKSYVPQNIKNEIASTHQNISLTVSYDIGQVNDSSFIPLDVQHGILNQDEDLNLKNPFSDGTPGGKDITPEKQVTEPCNVSMDDDNGGKSFTNRSRQAMGKNSSPQSQGRIKSEESFATFQKTGINQSKTKSKLKGVMAGIRLKSENTIPMTILQESIDSNKETDRSEKPEMKQLKVFLRDQNIMLGDDRHGDLIEKNSVSSQARTNKINAKLEHAIYLNETDISIKFLSILIVAFCVGSIALFIFCFIKQNTYFTDVDLVVQFLEASFGRIGNLVDLNRKARFVYIFQDGLTSVVRHTPDFALTSLQLLGLAAYKLSAYNNALRTAVHYFEGLNSGLVTKNILVNTYQTINGIRSENAFDLCTELSGAGLEIYSQLPNKPSLTDFNLNFILNNTLNGVLVESEAIMEFARIYTEDQVDTIRTSVIISLSVVVVISLIIFFLTTRIELKFKIHKLHFLETFLMIKDHEVEQPIYTVRNFYQTLKENRRENYFMERMADEKVLMKTKVATAKKGQDKTFKSKRANFKGIHVSMIYNLGTITVLLVIFTVVFIGFLQIFLHDSQANDDTRNKIVDAKTSFFTFGLLFTTLYEYIEFNGATYVMGIPISYHWEAAFEVLSASNSYLATFSLGEDNQEAATFLNGDLCALLFQNTNCYNDISGVTSKGIIALNSYMLKALRGVKDFYDSSTRDEVAVKETLLRKDLLDAEIAFEIYFEKSYNGFVSVLEQEYLDQCDRSTRKVLLYAIFSLLGCIILAVVVWDSVTKRMKSERKEYRNILRVIPANTILSNRFLKNYLFTHSKNILDSFKNRL